ncbi:MAG: hypothetical protein H6563_11975 [Lewinellaceae bacterium]|nr:hypothetical protein [Lewinellaceae bacterium]
MTDKNAILFWNRLLPEPESEDVADALRCDVRDPLWLLARQWQLGEFKAEDAGMAAFSHIIAHTTPLQRFSPPGQPSSPLPMDAPLDTTVERIAPEFDLPMRMEAGRKWRQMLLQAGKQDAWDTFCQTNLLQFKPPALEFNPENAELRAYYHEPYAQTLAALGNGRTVDGGKLYAELQVRKASDFLSSPNTSVDVLGKEWLDWVHERLGIAPTNPMSCWDPARLEYSAMAAASLPGDAAAFLQAPEHNGQLMEWHTWEQIKGDQAGLKNDLNPGNIETHRRTLIPAMVSFPGMPRARWWEMEDNTIDLSNVRANKTDTGLLLLTEFSLLYSNDWLLVPLALPKGVLSKIQSLRITDVFGVQSFINKQYAAAPNSDWGLFQIGTPTSSGWLWLPPVNAARLQSEPLEEIKFIRDEMANLVWAVEKTIPDGLGGSIDGASIALGMEAWLHTLAGEAPDSALPTPSFTADFAYRIGNTVPTHWIPFVPVRPDPNNAQMVLRRAAMPRLIDGRTPTRIRPRTQILRNPDSNPAHYDIREEEIPAMGLTVRSVWRRTRWVDGHTVTWLAREKSLGRYPESSGLQFDQLIEK